jgi:hypothetical protein
MRPITVGPYTPAVASTTAFNAQGFTSTGAATAPTTTTTTDGLAHYVTLTSPAQATLAGINFTIVGTDPDGHDISETIAGPASASTVTSTKFFKTITTIQPSATMGALVVSVGIAVTAITPTIALSANSTAAAGMTVGITGTINYTAYETFADVFNHDPQSVSTQISALASKTANTSANCSVSATGTFVLVNSVTATATLTVYLNQGTSATG